MLLLVVSMLKQGPESVFLQRSSVKLCTHVRIVTRQESSFAEIVNGEAARCNALLRAECCSLLSSQSTAVNWNILLYRVPGEALCPEQLPGDFSFDLGSWCFWQVGCKVVGTSQGSYVYPGKFLVQTAWPTEGTGMVCPSCEWS